MSTARFGRRRLLRAAASAPLTGLLGVRSGAAAVPALKDAAAAAGLRFGSSSDVDIARAPAAYATLFAAQCGLLAPQLGWSSVAPRPDAAEPAWEDPNVGFARTHGMKLTGAHLLWHENSPGWFADLPAGAAAQQAVDRHIREIAGHYAGRVFSWNVVNEAIDTRNGTSDGLRRSVYLQKLGPDFIARAFASARAADPHALLVYNDYSLETAGRLDAARRDALLRLLDRVQRRAPIDGVGLQSHLSLGGARFDAAAYRRLLRDIAARGLAILITELDVLDRIADVDIGRRDAEVAARYREFLSVALAEPAVASLVTWGLSDRYTWLTRERGKSFGRADGRPTRPLPFDADLKPKPAFHALLGALQGAPRRPPVGLPPNSRSHPL